MKRVHVLASPETIVQYAVAPIRHNRRRLRALGYDCREFYGVSDRLFDCNILLLISKAVFTTVKETQAIVGPDSRTMAMINRGRETGAKIVWLDSSDSTTVTHFELLPHVDLYLKKQLLKNREDYRRELHGGRTFTDFYHRTVGISDSEPMQPFAPLDPAMEHKVHLGWNIAFGDMYRAFTLWGRVRERIPRLTPLSYNIPFTDARSDRPVHLFLRTSANLGRETVTYQRREMVARLEALLRRSNHISGMVGNTVRSHTPEAAAILPETGRRLSTREYRDITRHCQIMPSPFGWGELGARDFEAFQNGTLMLKADMSHMETWPDIFFPGETYIAHGWDMADLEQIIENLIADPRRRVAIAAAGQAAYRNLISDAGMEAFCTFFTRQLELQPEPAA